MGTVVFLADFKKTKAAKVAKRRVRGPPKNWNVVEPEDIPVNRKGIVSGGELRCPMCGTPCLYTGAPLGRGHYKFRSVHKPICGFGCAWGGMNHFRNGSSTSCPGCAQNPIKETDE